MRDCDRAIVGDGVEHRSSALIVRDKTAIFLAAGVALFLLSRRSSAAELPASNIALLPGVEGSALIGEDGWQYYDGSEDGDPYNAGDLTLPSTSNTAAADQNLSAFLWMIGASETSPGAMTTGQAYNLFYGWTTFQDMSDHPSLTGEKVGVRLPDEWCLKAGFKPGCVSTAAGFAQINLPTWKEVRKSGVWGPYLRDFGRDSQIEAARRVLILSGALDYVKAGDFDTALYYAAKRWASLAGSKSGQPQKSRDVLYSYYTSALGAA